MRESQGQAERFLHDVRGEDLASLGDDDSADEDDQADDAPVRDAPGQVPSALAGPQRPQAATAHRCSDRRLPSPAPIN